MAFNIFTIHHKINPKKKTVVTSLSHEQGIVKTLGDEFGAAFELSNKLSHSCSSDHRVHFMNLPFFWGDGNIISGL